MARRGIPVTLLEREEQPGGLTAGTVVDGMPVDFGSHRLHPSVDPQILTDLRALLGEDLQVRRRNGRIRIDGTWISFPISPSEMVVKMSPRTLGRLGLGAARALVTPSRSDTFADVVATGLGRAMGELFYFPYATKIWGVAPERLSGEQARRRISADSPLKLLRKAFSRRGPGKEFLYPREGFGQIAESLRSAAVNAGAEIRLGSPVEAISFEGTEMVVESLGDEIAARLILSTIPITTLVRFLQPSRDVIDAVDVLRFRAMVLVYMTVPTDRWTPFDAHYFPEASVPFTRISEPKNYRHRPADPSGRTVLCVELPCLPDDETWARADDDQVRTVREGIVATGLPDPGSVGTVRRVRNAYPIYRAGSEEAFGRVASWLDDRPGLVSFGRQGLFAHDNTHHAMAMARDAEACVSNDLDFDRPGWERARERFARHVVED